MFGFDSIEFLVVAIVALVVIGPKDLPNVMRTVGQWVGRARGMARHFRSGVDTMIREAELAEMEKKWREENERIMREHPMLPDASSPAALNPPDFDDPAFRKDQAGHPSGDEEGGTAAALPPRTPVQQRPDQG